MLNAPGPVIDRNVSSALPAFKTLRNSCPLRNCTDDTMVKAFLGSPGTFLCQNQRFRPEKLPRTGSRRKPAAMKGRTSAQCPLGQPVEQPLQRFEPGAVGLARYRHEESGQGAQPHLARRRG